MQRHNVNQSNLFLVDEHQRYAWLTLIDLRNSVSLSPAKVFEHRTARSVDETKMASARKFACVVAVANKGGIGKNNSLPWKLQ